MPGPLRTSRPLRWALALFGLLVLAVAGPFLYMELAYRARMADVPNVPAAPVAIVFGAGLGPAGQPSPTLAARVKTAVALYQAGKVRRVLLSGNSERHHDEIRAMRRLAEAQGLPDSVLLLDLDGDSTFDTCLRARDVFGITQAILVTQRFHMGRALYIANALGIRAWGVTTAPRAGFRAMNLLRELAARPLAVVLVALQPRHAQPPARDG